MGSFHYHKKIYRGRCQCWAGENTATRSLVSNALQFVTKGMENLAPLAKQREEVQPIVDTLVQVKEQLEVLVPVGGQTEES